MLALKPAVSGLLIGKKDVNASVAMLKLYVK